MFYFSFCLKEYRDFILWGINPLLYKGSLMGKTSLFFQAKAALEWSLSLF